MKYFVLFLGLLTFTQVNAQPEKKINRCIKVFNKDQEKGIDKLKELMAKEDFASYTAFETLIKMELLYLQDNLNILSYARENQSEIMAESEEQMDDSTYQEAVSSLEDAAMQRFINVCRRATLESTSETGDVYLRVFLVDYEPDSAVSETGEDYFYKGEEYFEEEKFELAELEYRKALDVDSNYYKAILYLGDTFWARENFDSAMYFYETARSLHPTLLEPRKYIVDALIEQGLYYRAKKECLQAFCVYPGFDMKLKMQMILNVENKLLNDHRILRSFYINDVMNTEQRNLSGIWYDYRKAKDDISKYCNTSGIIEENGETKDKYLEVYSFRQMLENNKEDLPEYMEFGWKMKEEGYLEQYVFISQFHVDLYPQFEVFMSDEGNREKSIEYIEKYLIERKS